MAWTTPRSWSTGELVTASMMNVHVRDNLNYLLSRTLFYVIEATSTYTTTSTTYTAVNAAFNQTVTTSGGTVAIMISGTLSHSAGAVAMAIGVSVDGAAPTNYNVFYSGNTNADHRGVFSHMIYITGLSAASHTFNLRWLTPSGTATLTKTYVPLQMAGWEL